MTTHPPYRQAILRKGSRTRIAWIPATLAVPGRYLRLHDEDGWKVVSVSSKMDGEFIRDRSNDYRYQRRVSDV